MCCCRVFALVFVLVTPYFSFFCLFCLSVFGNNEDTFSFFFFSFVAFHHPTASSSSLFLVLFVFGVLEKAHYCVLDGKIMYVGVWTFCMQIVCFFLCYSPERSCKIAVASPPFLVKFFFFLSFLVSVPVVLLFATASSGCNWPPARCIALSLSVVLLCVQKVKCSCAVLGSYVSEGRNGERTTLRRQVMARKPTPRRSFYSYNIPWRRHQQARFCSIERTPLKVFFDWQQQ